MNYVVVETGKQRPSRPQVVGSRRGLRLKGLPLLHLLWHNSSWAPVQVSQTHPRIVKGLPLGFGVRVWAEGRGGGGCIIQEAFRYISRLYQIPKG